MTYQQSLMCKHTTFVAICLLCALTISGSASASEDFYPEQSDWSIVTKTSHQSLLDGVTLRPIGYTLSQRHNIRQPAHVEQEPSFTVNLDNNRETHWQIAAYADDGIGATEGDDIYGLSFTRQW